MAPTTENNALAKVLKLLPIHAAPRTPAGEGLPVKRGRGRPRKVAPAPVADDQEYFDEVRRLRAEAVARDPVVRALEDRLDQGDRLHAVLLGITEEAAALGYEIENRSSLGCDVQTVSSRRIDALRKISELTLAMYTNGMVADEASPRFAKIKDDFVSTVAEVAEATLGLELAALIKERLLRALMDTSTPI